MMIRKIFSVIFGYAIFVVTSVLLFRFSSQKPHAEAELTFQIFTALYGGVFSFISGLTTQAIGKARNLNLNYILAIILAGFAAFSMLKSDGSHWTQLLAIFIFAPVSVLGGAFGLRRGRK